MERLTLDLVVLSFSGEKEFPEWSLNQMMQTLIYVFIFKIALVVTFSYPRDYGIEFRFSSGHFKNQPNDQDQ